MTTLTATAGTVSGLPAVTLLTDAVAEPSTVLITRDPAGGAGPVVRGASKHLDTGGLIATSDIEAPLGTTVTYTLTVRPDSDPSAALEATATVDVPPAPAGAVLLDPFTLQWVGITVVDETRRTARPRAAVYWPAGATRPVVHADTAEAWTHELDIVTVTAAQRERLDELLTAGDPILVRYPAGVMLTAGWHQPVDNVDVERPRLDGTDPARRYRVATVLVDAPDPTRDATVVTLDTMHELEPTTLDALAGRALTLAALTQWAQDGIFD